MKILFLTPLPLSFATSMHRLQGKLKGMGFVQPRDLKELPKPWSEGLIKAFTKTYCGFKVIPMELKNVENWRFEMLTESLQILAAEERQFGLFVNNSIVRGAGNKFTLSK